MAPTSESKTVINSTTSFECVGERGCKVENFLQSFDRQLQTSSRRLEDNFLTCENLRGLNCLCHDVTVQHNMLQD